MNEIISLEDLNCDTSASLGNLIDDLAILSEAGLNVIKTVILLPDLFLYWQNRGSLCNEHIDKILNLFAVDGDNCDLIIRTCLKRTYLGLHDKVKVSKTFASLKYGIERIYRSWSEESARVSRVMKQIPDSESIPSLIIQPFVVDLFSVITRHAIFGTLTTSHDFHDNISNHIPNFTPSIERLVVKADGALLRPANITFTANPQLDDLKLISVTDETMTLEGRWRTYLQLLDENMIDEVAFLREIRLEMLSRTSGYGLDFSSMPAHVSGIAVSRGIAFGQLVFPGSKLNPANAKHPFVFLVEEAYPEHVPYISNSQGGIGLYGGPTCHLAAICRFSDKPAVVSCQGILDRIKRTYHLPNGIEVPEFTNAIIDGNSGMVGFGEYNPVTTELRDSEGQPIELITKVIALLNKATQEVQFCKLSLSDQWHISELKNKLRRIGYLK